jgi:hypothetical protein
MATKQKEEKPYGRNAGAWHQTVSKSDPCDSRGKASKKSQQVDLNAPAEAAKPYERDSSKDERTYDAREPKGAGDYSVGTRSSIKGTSTRANKRA